MFIIVFADFYIFFLRVFAHINRKELYLLHIMEDK